MAQQRKRVLHVVVPVDEQSSMEWRNSRGGMSPLSASNPGAQGRGAAAPPPLLFSPLGAAEGATLLFSPSYNQRTRSSRGMMGVPVASSGSAATGFPSLFSPLKGSGSHEGFAPGQACLGSFGNVMDGSSGGSSGGGGGGGGGMGGGGGGRSQSSCSSGCPAGWRQRCSSCCSCCPGLL